MITVIIAGGSGSRLWPLSTPDFPKHLLTIGESKTSLLQNTYNRVKNLSSAVYVVSEAGHIEHVREQLPELSPDSFVVEPARRGTANCIIAALAHISGRHDHDEPIAFTHADHYVRDTSGFSHSFRIAAKLSSETSRIVLVGVEPTYASTGFGYIEKGELFDEASYSFEVKSFTEKPDHDTARTYMRSGRYLWNGGYFVGSVDTFEATMKAAAPELSAQFETYNAASEAERETLYMSYSPAAIDYTLMEKVKNLLVIPAHFDWIDLGSYRDLTRALGSDELGNSTMGNVVLDEVENSLIQNKEEKPVVVIGLDNVVVINSPDGVLVIRKDVSQKVGDIAKRFTAEEA